MTPIFLLLALMAVVWSALASLRYQGRTKLEYEQKLKDEIAKKTIGLRQVARDDADREMEKEREQVRQILSAYSRIKIQPRDASSRYAIMLEFDREMVLLARHGVQDTMRYIALQLARKVERELCTLNLERFSEAEYQARRDAAMRVPHITYGDPA